MRFVDCASFIMAAVPLVSGITLDCKNVVIDAQAFDISPLAGAHSVYHLYKTPTAIKNTTYTFDLCKALDRKSSNKATDCPSLTRICGYERFYQDTTQGEPEPLDVWPIAGDFIHDNRPLEPQLARLKSSESHSDSEKEGLRITIKGGINDDVEQKAIIELLCDPAHTGLERRGLAGMAEGDEKTADPPAGDGEDKPLPDPNAGKALQFVSYKPEPGEGKNAPDVNVLRISWKTKYACEGQKDKPEADKPAVDTPPAAKKSGWGFFTWFIIILFLAIAGYLIFGSWLNFSQHGARGWDLLPHGDTIRDIPYLLKDWARRVLNTVQGTGSNRGGYSAVG